MLHLRVLLYLICFVSLSWLTMIFVGPLILKSIITSYSNGQLSVAKIVVTPRLDIKIGRMDYYRNDADGRNYRYGFSRSINIFWSIFGDEPFIKAQIGPTAILNTLSADSISINTPSFSEVNFQRVLIDAEVRNLASQSFLKSKELNLSAVYVSGQHLLSEILLNETSGDVSLLDSWVASGVSANIDNIDFALPTDEQKMVVRLSAEKLHHEKYKIHISDADGLFKIENEEIAFEIAIQNLFIAMAENISREINVAGIYKARGTLDSVLIEVLDNSAGLEAENRSSVNIYVSNIASGTYQLDILGNILPIELSYGENFIGNLPTGVFKAELLLDDNASNAKGIAQITFRNEWLRQLSGTSDISLELGATRKLSDCLTASCKITGVQINYKLDIGREWVEGVATCVAAPCTFSSLKHYLKTSNTTEIFNVVNQSKILNPLFSVYLYSLLSTGTKLDKGHELRLN